MINAPQRRLVPLERALQVSTSAPSVLGNNNGNNEEFNPFKYNATPGQEDSGPKYTQYESGAGVRRIDIAEQARNTPEAMVQQQSLIQCTNKKKNQLKLMFQLKMQAMFLHLVKKNKKDLK